MKRLFADTGSGSPMQVKLVTVTRRDLSPGYQLAQTIHSSSRFAYHYPDLHREWIEKSEYVVSLSVDNEEKLQRLFYRLQDNGAIVVAFHEPDIQDQLTSICYYGTPELRKITQNLDLALEEVKVAIEN